MTQLARQTSESEIVAKSPEPQHEERNDTVEIIGRPAEYIKRGLRSLSVYSER